MFSLSKWCKQWMLIHVLLNETDGCIFSKIFVNVFSIQKNSLSILNYFDTIPMTTIHVFWT